MTDDRRRRAEELFQVAADLSADERAAYLERECGPDAELRRQVERLLAAHEDDSDHRLGEGGLTALWSPEPGEEPGDVIGPYTLLSRLGEGGMGAVYLADQTEPVRRRVALKIIKLGMDTREVAARFEAERQALAMMDHPNVARVLDAGTTTTGRPYFVMDLVSGVPITEHCDRQRLDVDARLGLFLQVCDAVQHAHQKGIIHRDLKPSNILVTLASGEAVPKVIDFGVAKALHRKLTEDSVFTEQGQLIGTPEYMSPEQAEMTAQDIDTRSDVYSLGVLLYELLTGERPFSSETLRRAGIAEIQRIIREEDPPKPSTRLSELGNESTVHAAHRHADPKTLVRTLRGDLDWIVMKCLEKDRARRYDTASSLAADIRRHLEHEPVVAGPPSAVYRIRKFARRHRAGVAATAIVGVALVASAGVSFGFALSESQQREIAEGKTQEAIDARAEALDEAAKYEQIALFIDEMLAGVRPEIAGDLDKTLVRMILDEAALRVDRELTDRPAVEAAIRGTIGRTYSALAEYPAAVRHLERSMRIREEELGPDDPDTLQTMVDLAHVHALAGDFDLAEPLAMGAHERARLSRGTEDETTLTIAIHLATLHRMNGKYTEAESRLLETLPICQERLGPNHETTLDATYALATLYVFQERDDEAVPLHRGVLAVRERELGEMHPETMGSMDGLAMALMRIHGFEEAEELARRALDLRKSVHGPEHPATLKAMHNLATLLQDSGRLDQAEQAYLELRKLRERVSGPRHPDTLKLLFNLANLYSIQRRPDEALILHQSAYESRRETLGEQHPHTLDSQYLLACVYHDLGRNDEALPLCEDLLAFRRGEPQPDAVKILKVSNVLANIYTGLGRLEEALRLSMEVLDSRRVTLGDGHLDTLCSMMNVAWIHSEQGQFEEAARYEKEAVARARDIVGPHRWYYGAFLGDYAKTLARLDRHDECVPILIEAYEVLRETLGPAHGLTTSAIQGLAALYERAGDSAEADQWRAKLSDAGDPEGR